MPVPDERLDVLAKMYDPRRSRRHNRIYGHCGIGAATSKGEGWATGFWRISARWTPLHVVRCFEDDNITHVDGGVDPLRDRERSISNLRWPILRRWKTA